MDHLIKNFFQISSISPLFWWVLVRFTCLESAQVYVFGSGHSDLFLVGYILILRIEMSNFCWYQATLEIIKYTKWLNSIRIGWWACVCLYGLKHMSLPCIYSATHVLNVINLYVKSRIYQCNRMSNELPENTASQLNYEQNTDRRDKTFTL